MNKKKISQNKLHIIEENLFTKKMIFLELKMVPGLESQTTYSELRSGQLHLPLDPEMILEPVNMISCIYLITVLELLG